MKYANEARAEGVPVRTGEILYEAMPWLKQVTGKTIVIKYGGSAMENPQLAAEVMADIVLLKILGVNPVLVHGAARPSTAPSPSSICRWSLSTASASPPTTPWILCAWCSRAK